MKTNGVWTEDRDLKVLGMDLGARMTLVDCGNQNLLVHSPIDINETTLEKIRDSGEVRWVVAPNKWHHMFLKDFNAHFPKAEYFCAPGLEEKRKDFLFSRVISNEQNFPWNPELSHLVVEGIPSLNEVVFFHPKSRTLILTDLVIHITHTSSIYTKIWLKLLGMYQNFGWSPIERLAFIRDKSAFRRSLEKLMEWDFDRIVLSHGEMIDTGGKIKMAKAYLK